MLFLSTRLPQLELPRFLRLPLLAGAGETGLLPLLLLELQGLLGLGADGRCLELLFDLPLEPFGADPGCGAAFSGEGRAEGEPPAGAAWGFWEGADALSLAGAG